MVAALQFFEFLPIFEFETLLVVTTFIDVLIFNSDQFVLLWGEVIPSEVGGCEGVVVLLALSDLIHRICLVLVGRRRVLRRMIDCYVFSDVVCIGWTGWEVVDFCLGGELEFFCGSLR